MPFNYLNVFLHEINFTKLSMKIIKTPVQGVTGENNGGILKILIVLETPVY